MGPIQSGTRYPGPMALIPSRARVTMSTNSSFSVCLNSRVRVTMSLNLSLSVYPRARVTMGEN